MTTEATLVKRLGVGRTTVRDIRRDHLEEGPHWTRGQGGCVVYTAEGVQAVLDRVNAKKTSAAPGTGTEQGADVIGAGDSLPVRGDTVLEASVIEWRFPNRRILTAESNGRTVRVRVHDNEKFRAGMAVRVQMDPGRDDIGTIVGRGPRYPGRW